MSTQFYVRTVMQFVVCEILSIALVNSHLKGNMAMEGVVLYGLLLWAVQIPIVLVSFGRRPQYNYKKTRRGRRRKP